MGDIDSFPNHTNNSEHIFSFHLLLIDCLSVVSHEVVFALVTTILRSNQALLLV
jgi:hypothetical protein